MPPSPSIGVSFYGDWDRFAAWVASVEDVSFDDIVEEFGEMVKGTLIGHMARNDLRWEALRPITIKRKGFDNIYLETGQYMDSLVSHVSKSDDQYEVYVVPEGTHEGSGLPMQLLGTYLEYGTTTVVARPLWRPTFKEAKRFAKTSLLRKIRAKLEFK